MRVVGPNCLGLVNTDPAVRMNATLAPVVPPRGRIGFFSQSGALGIAILADAASRGLGLSNFVSAGNRADVSGNDLLQFWYGDDRTRSWYCCTWSQSATPAGSPGWPGCSAVSNR